GRARGRGAARPLRARAAPARSGASDERQSHLQLCPRASERYRRRRGCGLPGWAAAIPFGVGLANLLVALSAIADMRRSAGRVGGFGLALSGLIVGLAAMVVYFPCFLMQLGVRPVREAAARTMELNNLRQIALALHMHQDRHRCLPAPGSVDPD